MKWFVIIYNILDFIHDKILHPVFKNEPDECFKKHTKKRNIKRKNR